MKKILIVHNSARTFLTQRFPVALGVLSAGHEVHVATPDDGDGKRIRESGFIYHPIKMSRRGMNVFNEIKTVLELIKLYKKIRPDLVHHVTIKPIVYGGFAARCENVPAALFIMTGLGYIFTRNRIWHRILRCFIKRFYAWAFRHAHSKVIFQNPENRRLFIEWGLVTEGHSVLIKGSGVDMKKFHFMEELPGTPVVVLPSRMLWDKGVGEFVKAAKNLRQEGVKARFILVGDTDEGNPASITREQLQNWEREGFIEWWGRQSDMAAVYFKSHLICLPSYYPEGTPLVLIEAAACGKPIVTTDEPGCRQVVQHGVNGLLVASRDAKSLMNALRTLVQDEAMRKVMGKKGRELVEVEFSEEVVVRKTLEVYDDLLK